MPRTPKTALERLLRLRLLEEDIAVQALACCTLALHQLEQRRRALVLWRADLAAEGARALSAGEPALWQAGETEKGWSRFMESQLGDEMDAARERVQQAREQIMARRTARMAVETLVEESRRKTCALRERREQQSLDEWFQVAGGNPDPERLSTEFAGVDPGPANVLEDEESLRNTLLPLPFPEETLS